MADRRPRKEPVPAPKTRSTRTVPEPVPETSGVELPPAPLSPPSIDWILEASEKNRKNWDKVGPVLKALAAAHPALIPGSPERVRPRAIGIHEVLFQRHPEFSRSLIRSALEAISRTKCYQEAVAAGGPRYDVDGNVKGEVTAEQKSLAALGLGNPPACTSLSDGTAPAGMTPADTFPPPAAEKPADLPVVIPDRIVYYPIGVISTPWHNGYEMPPSVEAMGFEGVITIHPRLVPGLLHLDGFSHLIVIYDFDRVKTASLQVKSKSDNMEHGIFAMRFPRRPNPIGISVLELVRIDPPRIHVKNVDMLTGTPILDIKPYVPDFDSWNVARIGWYSTRSQAPVGSSPAQESGTKDDTGDGG